MIILAKKLIMPSRIYPNIAISEKYNACSLKAQLFYLTLFAFVDDFGTFLAEPSDIKALLFPKNSKMTISQIIKYEQELSRNNLLIFYLYQGKIYLQINSFKKFQVFGKGYNRTPKYPPHSEKDNSVVQRYFGDLKDDNFILLKALDKENTPQNDSDNQNTTKSKDFGLTEPNTADLLKALVNAWHTTTSNTNSISNSYSYKELDIDNLEELNQEEKAVLKCFVHLSFRVNKEQLDGWKKWLVELKRAFPQKDLVKNALKWRDYFEQKPPKRHKNSFRNWIEKPYADKKDSGMTIYEEANRRFKERQRLIKK